MKEWKLRILAMIAVFCIMGGGISLGEWLWNGYRQPIRYQEIEESPGNSIKRENKETEEAKRASEKMSEKNKENPDGTEEKLEETTGNGEMDAKTDLDTEKEDGMENSLDVQVLAEESVPVTVSDVRTVRTSTSGIDFEALQSQNPDIVAWIQIPGNQINYPIVQAKDNSYYLHRDAEGKKSSAGAIFLDYEDRADFSSLHNVIYGHHMKNGSMFKDISKYKDQTYLDNHSEIFLYTPKRTIHLKALAAVCTSPDAIRRKTKFESGEEFASYIQQMTKKAKASRPIEGTLSHLYSFVTCSYEFENARTILYAYEFK